MNLRVDLILPSEQRSGSLLNVKSLTRMLSIIGPVAAIMLVAWLAMNVMKIKAELNNLENQWEEASKRQQDGLDLEEQVRRNKEILKEFNGWSTSHLNGYNELAILAKSTPLSIQITSLTTQESIELDIDVPVRRVKLLVQGTAAGRSPTGAAKSVESLRSHLEKNPAIDKASVAGFGAARGADAGQFDRSFKIECVYKARKFR